MAIGSGIAAQLGIATESVVGTAVTVTRFFEFDSESLAAKKKVVVGGGLRPDKTFMQGGKRFVTTRDVQGDVTLNAPTKGLGLLLQHMLGSFATTAVQIASSGAFKQIHVPGSFTGKTFTTQIGRPRSDGTVEPFTYPGCKVSSWEISCAQSDLLKLKVSVDAMDELTTGTTPAGGALASASYAAAFTNWTFVNGTLLQGGTASTTSGLTSVAGGVALAVVTAASITGTNPLANSRYFLGNGTVKAEQGQNDYTALAGSFSLEFVNRAMYNLYRNDTSSVIELTFASGNAGGGNAYTLDIILPMVFFEDGASPSVGGPDVISQTVPFTAFDDGSGSNPAIQVVYISTDTAV